MPEVNIVFLESPQEFFGYFLSKQKVVGLWFFPERKNIETLRFVFFGKEKTLTSGVIVDYLL